MSAHEQLKFKLNEYLLKSIERKFKEGFYEARFRGEHRRANAAHARDRYDLSRVSRKEIKKISPEGIAQIEPNRLAAARCADTGAAKRAAI